MMGDEMDGRRANKGTYTTTLGLVQRHDGSWRVTVTL